MDKFGVIWTRVRGVPEKLADMVLTARELRITKTQSAIDRRLPGISVLHDLAGNHQINYRRSEYHNLPPQLASLLPSSDPGNPQRKVLSLLLDRKMEVRGMPVIERDWHMLLFAGHNGIGHIDVFASDEAAGQFYRNRDRVPEKPLSGSSVWFAFNRFIADTASDIEQALVCETVGPTPGISGFMSKLVAPVTIVDGKWDGGLFGDRATPAIIKVEQAGWPGLLALEQLAYEYYRNSGFEVPMTYTKTVESEGESICLLAIERFDRKAEMPVPMESFFSVLRTGSPGKFFSNTDGTMEEASRLFSVLGMPSESKEDWYGRFVMSFLTGNGDMHLENMSILGGVEECRLSPVYDPAPMRAYRGRSNHDLLSALPFNGIGGITEGEFLPYASSGDTPADLGRILVEFGKHIGIHPRRSKARIAALLEQTRDFKEEAIAALERVPVDKRRRRAPDINGFRKTLSDVRNGIETSFSVLKGASTRMTLAVDETASAQKQTGEDEIPESGHHPM